MDGLFFFLVRFVQSHMHSIHMCLNCHVRLRISSMCSFFSSVLFSHLQKVNAVQLHMQSTKNTQSLDKVRIRRKWNCQIIRTCLLGARANAFSFICWQHYVLTIKIYEILKIIDCVSLLTEFSICTYIQCFEVETQWFCVLCKD